MKRWIGLFTLVFVGVALVATAVTGDGSTSLGSLITHTEQAILVESLREGLLFLLVGGFAIGLGVGLVVASSVSFWYHDSKLEGGV